MGADSKFGTDSNTQLTLSCIILTLYFYRTATRSDRKIDKTCEEIQPSVPVGQILYPHGSANLILKHDMRVLAMKSHLVGQIVF